MKKFAYMISASSILMHVAFDNKKWKLDADGHIELRDGNPIMLDADGKELVVDHNTVARLNREAKDNRVAKEKAEASLAAFEGLDAEKARSALELAGKIDQKTLIDAGEVDKVRNEIKAQYEAQVSENNKTLAETQKKFDDLILSNAFNSSEFIRDRVAVPREMFEATFKNNFVVENGEIVPMMNGNKINSPSRFGEIASFDEAVEVLVNGYKHKDSILKAAEAGGSGSGGGGGGTGNGAKAKYTREQFEGLDPVKRSEVAGMVSKGEATLVG